MASSLAQIPIDGAHGDGGGALVRTALAMSALTQQPVQIDNIRFGTRFPGLDVEDVTILRALQRICQAEVTGGEPGSLNLRFFPSRRPLGLTAELPALRNDQGRGANVNVVLGTLLPVLARSGVYSTIGVTGETHGQNTLSYESFVNLTLPALRKVGLHAFPEFIAPGFGRDSEGQVTLDVEPSVLNGVQWPDRGSLRQLKAVVVTSAVPEAVADRAISHLQRLAQQANLALETETVRLFGRRTAVYVAAWAHYERGFGGGASIGTRGQKPEQVAQAAFEELFDWMSSSATLDPFLADHLLLPLVFAEGDTQFSVSRLTSRFLTSVWVVKQFTPIHITIRGTENGPGTVTIRRT